MSSNNECSIKCMRGLIVKSIKEGKRDGKMQNLCLIVVPLFSLSPQAMVQLRKYSLHVDADG